MGFQALGSGIRDRSSGMKYAEWNCRGVSEFLGKTELKPRIYGRKTDFFQEGICNDAKVIGNSGICNNAEVISKKWIYNGVELTGNSSG